MVEKGENNLDSEKSSATDLMNNSSSSPSMSSPTTSAAVSEASSPSFPQNSFPLTHQVAGHFFGKGKTKLGKRLKQRQS